MLMNTAEQILVIILASALAVFLVLAIIICVQLIKLMRVLQSIADKAQGFVNSAEATADMVKSAVGQLSVMRFVHSVFDMVQKHTKKDK
jgi:type IV secretory pathway component VirB8